MTVEVVVVVVVVDEEEEGVCGGGSLKDTNVSLYDGHSFVNLATKSFVCTAMVSADGIRFTHPFASLVLVVTTSMPDEININMRSKIGYISLITCFRVVSNFAELLFFDQHSPLVCWGHCMPVYTFLFF